MTILTAREACEVLRVSRTWLDKHKDEIPHYKLHGILRFDKDRLLEWLKSQEEGGSKHE